MPELSFLQLGVSPETEAPRMCALYKDPGVDMLVQDEFEPTVEVYRQLTLKETTERLRSRYGDPSNGVIGFIAICGETSVGGVVVGAKEFEVMLPEGDIIKTVPGVNMSGWVLSQYRQMGFGRQMFSFATEQARLQVVNPALSEWFGKQIWTSIKESNTASRRACENAGFSEAGPHLDNPGRLLYLAD